jgi:Domain of unknown function (DUF4386)
MTDRVVHVSRSRTARIAGSFYLLTFVTGLPAFFIHDKLGVALGLIAGACYIVVTLLLYRLFKPVNKTLSLIAALISLAGCAIGPVAAGFHFSLQINPLVLFGFYCLLIGYLIVRSSFLPRTLGVLMVFAGLGWLTFLSAAMANRLHPYNLVPGLIGEGALTLWLLAIGVNEKGPPQARLTHRS